MPSLTESDLWRSPDELADTPAFRDLLQREFPRGAAWLEEYEGEGETLRRRRFIQLMGASFALAGVTSCGRQKPETIAPYVKQPEDVIPGQASYYATALDFRGHARGILVESHQGRPTKIEGNPQHPASLGATDAPGQAAVLDLYDPDRLQTVKRGGRIGRWSDFEVEHRARRGDRGRGYAILVEPSSSPTMQRLLAELGEKWPEAQVFQHAPIASAAPEGLPDFSEPDVILAIDDDFLGDHPDSLRYTRQFASRRRGENLNRLYVIEPTPTLTGSMADHRLAIRPERIEQVCRALIGEDAELSAREADFVNQLRDDIGRAGDRLLVRAGRGAPQEAVTLQEESMSFPTAPPTLTDFPNLAALTRAIREGEVSSLLILGGNPVYTAPGDSLFLEALEQLEFSAFLGTHENETAVHCGWILPEAHFLETWGDSRAYDGTAGVRQPLIEPLYQGRAAISVLAMDPDARSLVRETWRAGFAGSEEEFANFWKTTLHRGFADRPPRQAEVPLLRGAPIRGPIPADDGPFLIIRPDASVGCGERANNGWMQELPRPFTKLVWDNAALVAPAYAERRGWKENDVIRIRHGDSPAVEAPVWILPGQADETITLHLGYGRTHAGTLGDGVGFNAFPLTGRGGAVRAELTGRRYELVSTQHHSMMEGRELYWRLSAEDLERGEYPHRPHDVPEVSLYPDPKEMLDGKHAWAMSIDLSTCIGCNACVTACQSENNIPVVGKKEVARGREMHWIRIDRYFSGERDNPAILHEPVTCQHCENAPCEVVCPVEATLHTNDGLNAMIYNRCVGTRYCSNNCPYKVRRFNFFDYRLERGKSDPRSLQANPDVTVRGRGVMEKCSYCVQRIRNAEIEAGREKRPLRDGEIVTACQQACPAEAITFGDLRHEGSEISKRKKEPRAFALLGELNTRPRTSYLAKIENPHR